ARFGPFREPRVGHPQHVERRLADELGDERVAVLRPRRVAIVDLDARLRLEGADMRLHLVDAGRPGEEVKRLGRERAAERTESARAHERGRRGGLKKVTSVQFHWGLLAWKPPP